jgi:hypothetical protein
MLEDNQNPNTVRNFSLYNIRFLKSSLKRSKNTGGGVKAVWKKSKRKQIFFVMASLNNTNIITETNLYQEEKVIELEPSKTVSEKTNINFSLGQHPFFKWQHCEYENIHKVIFQKHCNSKHTSVYMGSEEYGHECPLCSDKFTTTEAFNEHKADHLKEIESMDKTSLTNGHDIFECNLCSFESGHDDSVKEHMIEHVNAAPKKAEVTVKLSNDDNIRSFDSDIGESEGEKD